MIRYRYVMFLARLMAITATVVAYVIGVSGPAAADPPPPPAPPLPNVTELTPISPVDYTVMAGNWYAFGGPGGVVCVINRTAVSYGCSAPAGAGLPGAPEGANLVSGGAVGPPVFSMTGRPPFAAVGEVRPLPPGSRLGFRDISCGLDGAGLLACVNTREQVGFVIGPSGSAIDETNQLTDRPQG
jgi:hypothetical protein